MPRKKKVAKEWRTFQIVSITDLEKKLNTLEEEGFTIQEISSIVLTFSNNNAVPTSYGTPGVATNVTYTSSPSAYDTIQWIVIAYRSKNEI